MNRKPETVAFWMGRLPHSELVDGRYFVTLYVSGAIPEVGKQQIRRLSAEFERLRPGDHAARLIVQRRIFREMEAWLDRAERAPHLGEPLVAEIIMEAIAHRVVLRQWNVLDYVVMPTHVHLFFELVEGRLKAVLEDFKQWTGRQAAKFVKLEGDKFWHREWFDHWSRSAEEDERIVAYVRRNPVKAGLVQDYLAWPYGSWRANQHNSATTKMARDIGSTSPAGPAGRTNSASPAGPAGRT